MLGCNYAVQIFVCSSWKANNSVHVTKAASVALFPLTNSSQGHSTPCLKIWDSSSLLQLIFWIQASNYISSMSYILAALKDIKASVGFNFSSDK